VPAHGFLNCPLPGRQDRDVSFRDLLSEQRSSLPSHPFVRILGLRPQIRRRHGGISALRRRSGGHTSGVWPAQKQTLRICNGTRPQDTPQMDPFSISKWVPMSRSHAESTTGLMG
jgi:hypothetical protein